MRLFLLALCLPLFAATAQEAEPKFDGTVLHLSETARQVAAHDRVKATVAIKQDGKTPAEVQNYINRNMQAALQRAERVSDVKAETLGYNVYQRDDWIGSGENRIRVPRWYGQQTLQLDSADSAVLLDLVGKLQEDGFTMEGLRFYLSQEKSEGYRDQLIRQAIGQIQYRAKLIGQTLGMRNVKFREINFGGGAHMPEPMFDRNVSMMRAESMAAAPVAAGGEADVTVTVNAVVELTD